MKFLYEIEGLVENLVSSLNNLLGYIEAERLADERRRQSFSVVEFPKQNTSKPHIENVINRINSDDKQLTEDFTMYKYKGYTITKRSDGRWWARLQINGFKKSVYGKTVDDVKKKIPPAIKELKNKTEAQQRFTFFSWLNFWNDTYKKPYNRTDSISAQLKKHIFEKTSDKPLEKVTTLELQKLVNDVETSRSRVAVLNIIKNAFETALNTKVIKDNPATALAKVVHHVKKGEALTRAEEEQFLKDIKGHSLENLFKFYLLSGCRRGEALSLKKADINLGDKTLKIYGTKTTNSERTIPLFKNLEALLMTLPTEADGYFFKVHEDTITQTFKRFCPNHKLHDLRHTFATRCLEAGVAMKTVQIWLGHSDFETTANTYSHAQKEFQNAQANILDIYLDTVFDTVQKPKK